LILSDIEVIYVLLAENKELIITGEKHKVNTLSHLLSIRNVIRDFQSNSVGFILDKLVIDSFPYFDERDSSVTDSLLGLRRRTVLDLSARSAIITDSYFLLQVSYLDVENVIESFLNLFLDDV
jgi:hypothetical protein